jgi:hypothetical protein
MLREREERDGKGLGREMEMDCRTHSGASEEERRAVAAGDWQ